MMSPPSASSLDSVFGLVLELPARSPAPEAPARLDALFAELARASGARPAEEIQDMIWAIWTSHEDGEAEATMAEAIAALSSGALRQARPLLDRLVALHPGWAEAWNKRATLNFIERRDGDSLADIARTLELEPRHFGAVSGFGQICLRHGRLNEARAAFQIALAINPHLDDLRAMVRDLAPRNLMLH
ncbi:tetratricopeptide repeat protein [Microvirga thermotolerans]|uniref:Tetratricopeptide repeat protein n=1 Tax=Microvirga thermotolerans TaxID=2651334 RepID=A0A5P9JQ47_9HYPH|nr:tetratricopeptide repeat protein [Microvirga thermotolerans]QFU14892.1 hypothetical protein GDR74_00940 [Microvirga thermotolerans]